MIQFDLISVETVFRGVCSKFIKTYNVVVNKTLTIEVVMKKEYVC